MIRSIVFKFKVQLLPGITLPTDLDDPLEVVSDRLGVHVEDVPCVVHVEQYEDEDASEAERDLREELQPSVETGANRDRRDCSNPPDDSDLDVDAIRPFLDVAIDVSHSRVDRNHTYAERRAHPKSSASHRKRINDITERSVDDVSDERKEGGTKSERHVPAEADYAEKHCDKNVADPCMQSPMIKGNKHSLLRSLIIIEESGFVEMPRSVIVHGLGNPETVQPDANAAREQHTEPCGIREFRLLVLLAQLDVSIL
mmetsp:Transcript_60304/g.123921  ORF Transcript_60304/g.123921 Transcript_60304/m.123921 type:complete len:256 (+) Transcript_60304:1631-2398(+)